MDCRWGRQTAAATGGRVLAALAAVALAVTGCGGASTDTPPDRDDKLVTLRSVEFPSAVDSTQVAGLAAIPRALESRGCVIWQFGFRSTKENASYAWQGLAALGLTTFSIDLREHGARATGENAYRKVLEDPATFEAMVRESVGDLRSAVDYLEKQPYCRRNVGFAGVSLGGAIGTILAAEDPRVKAVILAVTPGNWRQVVGAPDSPMLRTIVDRPDELREALKTYAPLDPARYVDQIAPRPVLILSGDKDRTVVLSNARKLQGAARTPKRVVVFRGDHNPVVGPDAEKIGNEVGSFLLRSMVQPTYDIKGNVDATFYERDRR